MKFKSLLTDNELRKTSELRKADLKNTAGLISLFCHHHPDNGWIYGTFIFKNLLFAQSYVDEFLLKGLGLRYGIVPDSLKIEIDELDEILIGTNH